MLELTGEFCAAMLSKHRQEKDMPMKALVGNEKQPINGIINRMGWDNMLLVVVPERGNAVVEETEILRYAMHNGAKGRVGDLFSTQTPPSPPD